MARKSTFDENKAKQFVAFLTAGNFKKTAAARVGIPYSTVKFWIAKGTGPGAKEPFATFAQKVEQAQAYYEIGALEKIDGAVIEDWRAQAWRLEKLQPVKYGEKTRVVVEAELDAFLEKLEKALPPDAYRIAVEIAAGESSTTEAGEAQFV